MIPAEKIEEWIKDVEQRPGYAPIIIQFIANRLRDLSERNEALAAENIALQTGQRVEQYEQRIAYLEYQLDLLKRQLGGDLPEGEALAPGRRSLPPAPANLSLLVYDARGRVLRLGLNSEKLANETVVASLSAAGLSGGEPLRLSVLPSTEELLFVFTSGRVSSRPVASIPLASPVPGKALEWEQATAPDEPHGGESLACIVPISKMTLAEFVLQVSRRGSLKKLRASMAQSILANHYIGAGVKKTVDRTFDILLCGKDRHLALVSQEGYLLILGIKDLPVTLDEALRLTPQDHLASAFLVEPGRSILVMTQVGKAIHLAEGSLELAGAPKTRGQAVFSRQRREQGVRTVAAAAASEADWAAALHRDGQVTLHAVREVFASGVVPVHGELAAFTFFSTSSVGT